MDIDDFIENLTKPCDIDHSQVIDFLDNTMIVTVEYEVRFKAKIDTEEY